MKVREDFFRRYRKRAAFAGWAARLLIPSIVRAAALTSALSLPAADETDDHVDSETRCRRFLLVGSIRILPRRHFPLFSSMG